MNKLRGILVTLSRLIRGEISTKRLIKMGLIVGKNFSREGGVRIDASYCHLIKIGDDVTLAPNVHLLAHDASLKIFLGLSRVGKVNIGNKVFIGANTIILPNCNIGDNVIVGAGSVVTKNIPSNSVYAGNPAKLICPIDEFLDRNKKLSKELTILPVGHSSFSLSIKDRDVVREEIGNRLVYQECINRHSIKDNSNDNQ